MRSTGYRQKLPINKFDVEMADNFHLGDLVSQASAVHDQLAGITQDEKFAWLSHHGHLCEIQVTHPKAPQIWCFESNAGIRSIFFFDDDTIVFVGDNRFARLRRTTDTLRGEHDMKDLPLCERCGEPVSPDDDVYEDVLLRHHGHRECARLADEHYQRQVAAREDAERRWAGKERECPKCKTRFTSVQNKGVCPECQYVFYASCPELGDVLWWQKIE